MKIIRKSILELSESEKAKIDIFIEPNNGLIFHEIKFNEIVSDIFNTNLFYFIIYNENRLLAVCPLHSIKRGILNITYSNNGGFEIPYGGWVADEKFTNYHNLWNSIPIRFNESLTLWSSFLNDIPKQLRQEGKNYKTGIINLNYSEKEIFETVLHSKRRNMIRKAENSGITIAKYGPEGLPIFYKLMHDLHKKTGVKELPLIYYKKVLDTFFPTGNSILMIAFRNNDPLSGIIIVGNKNVMHYWQGASSSDASNFGQGEQLQWEAIKWAKNNGTKYYDLCVIESEQLPNIAQFKMGFVREMLPFYCIIKKRFFFKVVNKIQNVFIN